MNLNEGMNMNRADYIQIALDNEMWGETVASFKLEGIHLTDDDHVIAGRMIVGELTTAEALSLVREKAGVAPQAGELGLDDTVH